MRGAIRAYERVLAQHPGLADAWFNLAYALKREGSFAPALQAYARAAACNAANPEQIHLNCAVIHADHLGDDVAAEYELQKALALAPDFAPALLNLGNLHEERGHRELALQCYDRILARPIQQTGRSGFEALARTAHLRAPADVGEPILRRLQTAADTPAQIEDDLRANLHFALGRAFDSVGEYGRAFERFRLAKQVAHRGYPAYEQARAERRTQALISAFPEAASVQAAMPAQHPMPLFICGLFRSGSTLVEQVLAGHPLVAAAGELELLPRMVATELAPFPASMGAWSDAHRDRLSDGYLRALHQQLASRSEGRRYATDKRPDNYLLIGLIKRLFPQAKIIHTIRDPLDNGLSIFTQHLNPRVFDYAGSLEGIGHHDGQYRRLMAHWKALYPADIHDFEYDAFVSQPEPTLRALLSFLGLEWDARCLQFHRLNNTVKTASYWQVRRPLYRDASGRWRNYRAFLSPLRESLEKAGTDFDWNEG